jgi:hypothetical protein
MARMPSTAARRKNDLLPLMNMKVGERLQFRAQRDSGEPRAVTLVAVLQA